MRRFKYGIVIPVYNGFRGVPESNWLRDSIDSAINQDDVNAQVTIVDDGSNDGTLQFIRDRYLKCQIIACQENLGVSHALNVGIDATDAEYIAVQGSDDLSCPDRLFRQGQVLDECPQSVMVGCNYSHIDQDATEIQRVTLYDQTPEDVRLTVLSGTCKIGSPMLRKDLWKLLGGFDEVNFPRCAEDFDFFLRTAERYPIEIAPYHLYSYRDTPLSLTKNYFWGDYYRALDMSRARRRADKSIKPLSWRTAA